MEGTTVIKQKKKRKELKHQSTKSKSQGHNMRRKQSCIVEYQGIDLAFCKIQWFAISSFRGMNVVTFL